MAAPKPPLSNKSSQNGSAIVAMPNRNEENQRVEVVVPIKHSKLSALVQVLKNVKKLGRKNKVHVDNEELHDDTDFLQKYGQGITKYDADDLTTEGKNAFLRKIESIRINPASNNYYYFTGFISLWVLYNLIVIIPRSVFEQLQLGYVALWLVLDYLSDFCYLLDMFVKFRTAHLEQGLLTQDGKKLALHYIRTKTFVVDIISVFPTDFFYLITSSPIIRINRLLRVHRLQEFTERTEARTSFPNAFRILYLVCFIIMLIHWNACLYFAICLGIRLDKNNDTWIYNDEKFGNAVSMKYVWSFFWSTLTLTTIGETPAPVTDIEFIFVTIDFLIGVLIFATIVGNVATMIANMNASRTEFQNQMDSIKSYMEFRKVGKDLEDRVIKWFDYLWSNKQSLNEEGILTVLPSKLQAEIAIQVHFQTLRKVKIFQDCEAGLLAELVLKLKLQVFSPGDYICRKGDIGREMYIVKRGKISVVADDGVTVFVTLNEGAVFGELSILGIAGNKNGNRRTANVRSVGYSDLFALSKDDLWEALTEYPDAREMLMEKGKQILRKDNLLDESASEESETVGEKAARLETTVDVFQTRFARLLAEHVNNNRKLRERLMKMEKRLQKYKDTADAISPIKPTIEIDAASDGLPSPKLSRRS